MKTLKKHQSQIKQISKKIKDYSVSHKSKKLRFYHGSTNSTRQQNTKDYHWVDITGLSEVIEINNKEKYVLAEPNVPMDKLVSTTLGFGLIPPVVMEFPGITCGGAVNGASLESSSFRWGQLSDVCSMYEIILGNGKIIKASPNKNRDIFYGISGSYGTLGLISLTKIKLIPSSSFVHTKFYPSGNYIQILKSIKDKVDGGNIDYIEGVVFNSKSSVLITGELSEYKKLPIRTYSKATDLWFYERAKKVSKSKIFYEELIPIKDYLFRYNRGGFWGGEYVFPIIQLPSNRLTKFLLNPLFNTRKLYDGLHALNASQRAFIQDFYCPFSKAANFLKNTEKNIGVFPIWVCPIKSAITPQKLSPHYIKERLLIDIGIWGYKDKYLSDPIKTNRDFEKFAKSTSSRKMLYAHSYYTEEEFWKIYDKTWYKKLRKKYFADAFPDIWTKVKVSEVYSVQRLRALTKIAKETLQGKNLNT